VVEELERVERVVETKDWARWVSNKVDREVKEVDKLLEREWSSEGVVKRVGRWTEWKDNSKVVKGL
jgi:hypothetical protein